MTYTYNVMSARSLVAKNFLREFFNEDSPKRTVAMKVVKRNLWYLYWYRENKDACMLLSLFPRMNQQFSFCYMLWKNNLQTACHVFVVRTIWWKLKVRKKLQLTWRRLVLASRNIVTTPMFTLSWPTFAVYFLFLKFFLVWSRSILIQRRASFDRTRFLQW